jgi:hypothetical protein
MITAKEPNDLDQEQWEDMVTPPAVESDPDAEREMRVYEGSLLDDCKALADDAKSHARSANNPDLLKALFEGFDKEFGVRKTG